MANLKNTKNSNGLSLPPLVLASGSPRRREILKQLGMAFQVKVPKVREATKAKTPSALVTKNALLKARAISKSRLGEKAIVIGSDTMVVFRNQMMGKPADRAQARDYLSRLSGKTHRVLTSVALKSQPLGERVFFVTSYVCFRKIGVGEMEAYLDTSEPYDKAGAYAIQGMAASFVKEVRGSYFNVIGFPVERFLKELGTFSKRSVYDWVVR